MTTGWNRTCSPFHRGEQVLQQRAGLRDPLETLGRRVIRDYLPEQHRRFYAQLPYLFVGSIDQHGRPWGSMLVDEPGFVSSPAPDQLHIAAAPASHDPLASNLKPGSPLGLLGLDLATRRRNRASGRVTQLGSEALDLKLHQAFGNCPKYINPRAFAPRNGVLVPAPAETGESLSDAAAALIAAADTFFIASHNPEGGPTGGVDISHRGGLPGFVAQQHSTTLCFPDFAGNNHFNTFGNLEVDPRAGLLFVDFGTGDALYLTGRADVIWCRPPLGPHGIERWVRFELDRYVLATGSLPIRFVDR